MNLSLRISPSVYPPAKLKKLKIRTFVSAADQLSHLHESVPPFCGSSSSPSAVQLFDELPHPDVVSASALLSRLAMWNRHRDVVHLFSRMLAADIRPNEFTFGTVIPSATVLGEVSFGKILHSLATKMGLRSNVFVGSVVLDFYSKLSSVDEARNAFEDTSNPNVISYTTLICAYLKRRNFEHALYLFEKMPDRNVVSWNAMIGGYSQAGNNEEAINLFIKMLREGLMPNKSTFSCTISASSSIAALGIGRSFHACAIKFLSNELDLFVGNSLISFYAKSGSIEDSLFVFNRLKEHNIVSFNSVICGFAQNGKAEEAIDFFERMRFNGFIPNDVTYLGLLLACNHAGLVDLGRSYFNKAKSQDPTMLKPEHYACLVDLLSRCGRFNEAEEFIKNLPFDPGIGFWKAILGGCQIHSNFELGEVVAREILSLDPQDVSSYVMLSNAYSAAGKWDSVSDIRREMKEKGMKRVPGSSWIEVKDKVHVFVTGDRSHDHKHDIYTVMNIFIEHLKEIEASDLLILHQPLIELDL